MFISTAENPPNREEPELVKTPMQRAYRILFQPRSRDKDAHFMKEANTNGAPKVFDTREIAESFLKRYLRDNPCSDYIIKVVEW